MQFIPFKPDKYGQKFWIAVDLKTKYLLNAFPYFGKSEEWPKVYQSNKSNNC